MQAKAYAKINWDLRILGKRADNFHELDSIFVNLGLNDDMSFDAADELSMTCSDPTLPVDGSNLVLKAAALLAAEARKEYALTTFGAKIHLLKRIPMGGGMGGGSSDAACALHALNRLWRLNWSVERLAVIGAQVGSDVAYFLYGGWCLCRGRGEIVERLPGSLSWPAVKILMVLPPLHVATPAVYKALNAAKWDGTSGRAIGDTVVNASDDGALDLRNDLSDAARIVEPKLLEIQKVLNEFFPGRWLMSGSGASHFAIPARGFERVEELRMALNVAVGGTRLVETETISGSI